MTFFCLLQPLHAKQTMRKQKCKQQGYNGSPKRNNTQTFLQHAPPTPGSSWKPPNGPIWQWPDTPSTISWRKQQMFGVLLLIFAWLPRGLFSNLRTACSETLMLRDRKASMADRSLSSLTGELLLLVTAAVAFTTFAARRLGGDGYPCRGAKWGGSELVITRWWWWWLFGSVEGEYVACGGGCRNRHPSTRATWASDQRPHATCHTVGRQGTQGRATEVKGQQSHRKGATRSNARRIRDDTSNPQNHNHNAAPNHRRQEKGQMKNWKKNKTRWKLTAVNTMNQITGEQSMIGG